MKRKVIIILLFVYSFAFSQDNPFNGKWVLIKDKSTDIDRYQYFTLDISINKNKLTFYQEWGRKKNFTEKMELTLDGKIHKIKFNDRIFQTNLYMSVKTPVGEEKEVTAKLDGNILIINEKYSVKVSQGKKEINVKNIFELTYNNNVIIYQVIRDTREGLSEIKYTLKRDNFHNAYMMKMTDNWEIDGKLPEQACLITLQGIVNEKEPLLYFIYGEQWDFRYTPTYYEYIKDKKYFTFTQLNSLEQAINTFKDKIKGYIVWDKNVRTSLIVSFTVAGLEKAIVVTEDMLPLMEKFGLNKIEDFRGKFTGQTDYEIYTWAYNKYWKDCSRDFIFWIGGEHGKIMKPGVVDYGMQKRAFFTDLSADEKDTLEFELTKKLFSEMKPYSMVMGWHSYKKDLEETFVALLSKYTLRMEGLHTLPNMSFKSKVPLEPGFKFKNNHNIAPGKEYKPEKKVYISFIQTDGIGLGAWTRPGRGLIPYSWEVTMNLLWIAPSLLECFYNQATKNDYFIGALSGPGYLYPKNVPKEHLPKLIEMAKDQMKQLDLNVFEIMDYSEDGTIEGNSDLTPEVVNAYFKYMPDAIGFVNGYYPSSTFAVKGKRALISYDYYLSKERPEEDAVSDLKELARLNPQRPYFLLAHIRQWSDITRVKSIYDKLGPEFELVPLDIFLKMAGENPTFTEKYFDVKERKKRPK